MDTIKRVTFFVDTSTFWKLFFLHSRTSHAIIFLRRKLPTSQYTSQAGRAGNSGQFMLESANPSSAFDVETIAGGEDKLTHWIINQVLYLRAPRTEHTQRLPVKS